MSKDLLSIDDFAEDNSNLPSINDYLTEEVEEDLPSVKNFIEKQELREDIQTIEDANGETFAEIKDIVPPWKELIRLINDVREEIPDIPEIKYYDSELEKLCEIVDQVRSEIPTIPEVKYYDSEIEAICEQIDQVKNYISSSISELPEIKYYDDQIVEIEEKLSAINHSINTLPEPKYYENDLQSLKEDIEKVRSEIPLFPKWVNEVNEVPDFSWIGKTFSVIDDDFIKVNDTIETLGEKIKLEISKLSEENETRYFESKVQFGTDIGDLDNKLKNEKEKIWKELRESSLKIWEYHKEFKDDDRKLKKQILGEYNKLKQNITEEIKKYNQNSVETDKLLLNYFEDLRKEISELPEVKYYDDDLRHIRVDIKELRDIVKNIKLDQESIQESIQEGLLNEPPDKPESVDGQKDPLTPMDQKFATLDDLAGHYRLFINRIQQQISTIGGGGAGFIKDLDDVSFDQTTGNNKLLIYDQANSKWVGIASTALSGSTALVDLTDVNITNLGDGRFLRYDASSSEFTFSPVSATNLELIAGDIQSGILTTTSILPATVMSISATTYRSVNYQIQVTEGTNYNMTTINVIHDGTTTYMTEYGTINHPVGVATFSTDISGGALRLLGYPSSTNSTTFKVIFTALES